MNLIRQIFLIVVLIWIVSFYRCSTLLVKFQGYHLGSTQDIGQENIMKELEENRIQAILLGKQRISIAQHQEIDQLSLTHSNKLDSIDLGLLKHLSTLIMILPNQKKLFGYTNTVGNTTNYE